MMGPKVKFEKVFKKFKFHERQMDKLLDLLFLNRKSKSFTALRNISFEVQSGESIGVIGINGSGKSTLSNLLAQVVPPTSGKIQINGEPSLIAISAGLNNNLNGLENIELKCLMLGLNKEEIREITPKIIEFADIGEFIGQPVKNYSSGMKSRLGFAISVHTDPDVIIIDEALSVGDETFHNKCLAKMNEFKETGKTIFFISHSISQVKDFTDRVMWLHFGQIEAFGEKAEVLTKYKEFNKWFKGLSDGEKKEYRKKMIQEQFKKHADGVDSRVSKSRKEKKWDMSLFFQFILLLSAFLYSVFSLFKI